MLLTAGSLAQHLDASLCVTLGFLQLTLVGVGGGIGAANRCHQGRTVYSLADTLSLGGVGRVTLTYSTEATQHPSAACKTRRNKEGGVRVDIQISEQNITFLHDSKVTNSICLTTALHNV